jgi:hypothetical protein
VALAVQRQEIDWPSGAGADEQPTALPPSPAPSTASDRARARSSVLAAGQADSTLTALLAGLVSLYDVDGGTIFLTEEDGLSLRRAAVLGDRDQSDNGQPPEPVQLGEGAIGRAALERRVQLVHGSGSPELAQGRATICAPMIAFGRMAGVICLTTRPSRLVGRGELLLLQAFANRVGEVLLSAGGDQRSRLRVSLERFRASWSNPAR